MLKKKIIVLAVILSLILILTLFIAENSRIENNFLRVHFINQKQIIKSKFSNCVIPGKTESILKGETIFLIKPGVNGTKGILFDIYVKCNNKREKVLVKILINRNKKNLLHKKLLSNSKGKITHLFSEIFEFKQNDIVKIIATGEGVIILKDAVVYDIIGKNDRKYVFVIALDNLRKDELGKIIKGVELTPNLNDLLADSVFFKNTYAQSSWTYPSFTSFFTGLYEFNHTITRHTSLAAKKPFLIENFTKNFITVSIHGGTWLSGRNVDYRGFDYFKYGTYLQDVYASEKLFNNAIKFLKENQVPSLFMFLHTYAIHAPYYPPKEFLLKLNKNPSFFKHKTYTDSKQYKADLPLKNRIAMEELYEADIMAFDHYLGKFLHFLKREGIYKNSLIVFFSDHGEEFYEHKGWFHGHSLYNEIIKVPMIIKFPYNKYKGTRIIENSGVLDILPTLMDYLKIENKNKLDGYSLMPLIKGKPLKRKLLVSSITSCYLFPAMPKKIALFAENFKMIYNFSLSKEAVNNYHKYWMPPKTEKIELFNLIIDPGETQNIFQKHPGLVKKIQNDLIDIIKIVKFNLKTKGVKKKKLSPKEINNLKALGYL